MGGCGPFIKSIAQEIKGSKLYAMHIQLSIGHCGTVVELESQYTLERDKKNFLRV